MERAGLKVDRKRIRSRLKAEYNILTLPHRSSQYRADFILQKRRLQRRKGSLLGHTTFYQAPETLILAKLRMIKNTIPQERSIKDRDDILGILSNTKVNMEKIRRAARKESTLEILKEIRRNK